MFAVLDTGGKQYDVKKGSIIKTEKLPAKLGETVLFDKVLIVNGEKGSVSLGEPYVKGAVVKAEVLNQDKDKKIIVFKKKRRQGYRRKQGHRQESTVLKITSIEVK